MKYPFYIETNATWGTVSNESDWTQQIENVKNLYNLSDEDAINHLLTYHSTVEGAKKFSEMMTKINNLLNFFNLYSLKVCFL